MARDVVNARRTAELREALAVKERKFKYPAARLPEDFAAIPLDIDTARREELAMPWIENALHRQMERSESVSFGTGARANLFCSSNCVVCFFQISTTWQTTSQGSSAGPATSSGGRACSA
jgi:hypothetical protein